MTLKTDDAWSHGHNTSREILLGCGIGGLQFVWSVLQATLTPFLESLGFSTSACALAWGIGPVMGAVVQPVFGRWSDRFRHPVWDRRRPFMIGGGAAVSVSLIGLATSETSARLIAGVMGPDRTELDVRVLAQTLAISWLFLLHLGVQPLQLSSRAYIVESCGPGNEVSATAWAGRLQGICGILGFALASTAVSGKFSGGNLSSDLTMLCIVIDILFLAMILAACSAKRYVTVQYLTDEAEEPVDEYQPSVLEFLQTIPTEVRHVLVIQWFSWMAWFPFTAYYASYVNSTGTQKMPIPLATEHISSGSPSSAGAFAGLLLSVVAFVSISILPVLTGALDSTRLARWTPFRHRSMETVLKSLWGCSQIYFVVAMALTPTVRSQSGAIFLVSSIGVPWGVSQWVPHGLLGIMLNHDPHFSELPSRRTDTGVVIALHNTAISAPQIISALLSSVVPMLVSRQGDVVGWTLRMGAGWMSIAAMFSFYFCFSRKHDLAAKLETM